MEKVTTIYGLMDPILLEKKTGEMEDDVEKTNWIEYWLKGELVHRSVHVHLKKNVFAEGIAKMLE